MLPRRVALLVLSLLCGVMGCSANEAPSQPGAGQTPPAKVELQVVPLDTILKQISAQKGNIVVVDSWATWCGPCKKEFPHLVEIHRDRAKDGVVCMSVSLDQVQQQGDALAFLKEQGATFPNFLVEDDNSWLDKWNIKGIPVVLVFGRDGKLLRKFDRDDPDNQFTYADVARFVRELVLKAS